MSTGKKEKSVSVQDSQFLQSLIQASPLAIIAINPEGNIIMWSPAAERIFGWSGEEVLGKPNPIVPEEKQDEFRAFRQRILQGESFSGVEVRRQKKDGTLIDVSLSTAPLYDAAGNIIGAMAAIEGISKRKQIEESLRQSEERYRKLVEELPVVIYSLSEDGTITSLNPAFEKITGWQCSEWIGKPFMGIIHPDDLPFAIEIFQQVLRGKTSLPYELRVLSKRGEYLVGGFVSTPQIKDGKIAGEFGTVCDITEHKHTEDKIKTLSELNEKIIRTAPIGIHVIDKDFIVRIWNSYLETYTTVEAKDVIGKNLFEVIPGLISSEWDKEYSRVIETGEPLEKYGYKYIRTMGPKKGEVLYQNTKIVPLKQDGNVFGAITILEDTTTHKKTEKELTEKVEELEKFYEMAVGREIKMKELKEETERLKAELSRYKQGV